MYLEVCSRRAALAVLSLKELVCTGPSQAPVLQVVWQRISAAVEQQPDPTTLPAPAGDLSASTEDAVIANGSDDAAGDALDAALVSLCGSGTLLRWVMPEVTTCPQWANQLRT